jgi:hypothetical protein
LHYAPPRSVKRGFPISAVPGETPQEPAGPAANPGNYRVRLRIGAHQWEESLVVAADPRVKLGPEGFSAQFDLARRLAAALDGSTGALLEARSLRAQLKDLTARAGENVSMHIRLLDDHIAAVLQPADASAARKRGLEHLNGDLATLYTSVTGVDAAPTAIQATETELALKEWSEIGADWQRLRDDDVAALNRELDKVPLPRLRDGLEPPRDLDFADEE